MSPSRKQRDNFVQSLFPFLAVLLSTMGALVLLLMLIVNQAQASAKHMAAEKKTQIEDAESNLQLLRNTFETQLEDRRLDIERKRLTLQYLEKQIQEIIAELTGIQRTAELLTQKQSQDVSTEAETERKISLLEKQLNAADIDLKKKLDKPEGDKPIFAIIPYQGTNGTHRRPIYLECTAQGITIQPEGVVIGLADLRPPYGPGNPLDAAIRTVRSHFAPASGALTSTAYPLLVVRPSGVRTYAMARQAMSGWDDQFGYELIDENLELTYPESQPGITAEIHQAVALARERQAALMMAMPAKYRQSINHGDGPNDQFDFSDDGGDMGDDWVNGGSAGNAVGSGSRSSAGSRGGFASSPPSANSRLSAGNSSFSDSNNIQGIHQGNQGTQGSRASRPSLQPAASNNQGNNQGNLTGSVSDGGSAQGQANSQLGFGGSTSSNAQQGGTSYFAEGSQAAQPGGPGSYFGSNSNGDSGGSSEFADSSSRSLQNGNSGSSPGSANADGSSGSSGGGTGNSGGSATGPNSAPGGNSSTPGGSSAGGSTLGNSMGSPPGNASQDPTANPGESSPSGAPSVNMDLSRNMSEQGQNSNSHSAPVAQQLGRNWAWSEGPPSKTAVVRSIRVVCYHDRWVLMQDNTTTSNQVTVAIGQSPQTSAEKLGKAITERVSGWGIALGGGYWKPELVVDVAPGAEGRFGQLERLLEGSGLTVRRRAAAK